MTSQSTAYDLSLFEARKERRERKGSSQIKVVKSQKTKKRTPIKKVAVFCLFVALIATLIYSKVQLTEITDKTSRMQSELAALNGETTRLELELEGKTSFGTVEEYATEYLGLSKVSASQIEYIDLSDGNKVESLGETGLASVWAKLRNAVVGFVEYIGN